MFCLVPVFLPLWLTNVCKPRPPPGLCSLSVKLSCVLLLFDCFPFLPVLSSLFISTVRWNAVAHDRVRYRLECGGPDYVNKHFDNWWLTTASVQMYVPRGSDKSSFPLFVIVVNTHRLAQSSPSPCPAAGGSSAASRLCRSQRNQPVHTVRLLTESKATTAVCLPATTYLHLETQRNNQMWQDH